MDKQFSLQDSINPFDFLDIESINSDDMRKIINRQSLPGITPDTIEKGKRLLEHALYGALLGMALTNPSNEREALLYREVIENGKPMLLLPPAMLGWETFFEEIGFLPLYRLAGHDDNGKEVWQYGVPVRLEIHSSQDKRYLAIQLPFNHIYNLLYDAMSNRSAIRRGEYIVIDVRQTPPVARFVIRDSN